MGISSSDEVGSFLMYEVGSSLKDEAGLEFGMAVVGREYVDWLNDVGAW